MATTANVSVADFGWPSACVCVFVNKNMQMNKHAKKHTIQKIAVKIEK